ncbi:GTP-binding protein [Paraburkholderia tropica]|uniref:CobW family GTP-binding protein n=1 Tax=Paraburkholderia tropica TaxID=92647 RepID=UPI003016B5A1
MLAAAHDERIPVTLLTGFLGSGKTTLLNRWLTDEQFADAAVIVNEFGAVGIDHALIASSSDARIELKNGCLCCVMSGDLVDTLRVLFMERAEGKIRPFQRLVIETSGLADPVPVMQMLMTKPAALRYRLARTITTIDTTCGLHSLESFPETNRQASIADHLVLTKSDLTADASRRTKLEARLVELNPSACRHYSSNDEWPRPRELAEQGMALETRTGDASKWLNFEAYDDPQHDDDGRYARYGGVTAAVHSANIRTFAMTFSKPIEWEHLAAWLDALTIAHPQQILRVKGIFAVSGSDAPIAVHAVQGIFHPPVALAGWPDESRISRVVFITQGIDREYVSEVLDVILSREPMVHGSPQL